MPYIKDNLNLGELVIHSAAVARATLIPATMALLLSIIGFVYGMLFGQSWSGEALGALVMGSFFCIPVGSFYLVRAFLRISSTEYAITTHRVIVKIGLVRRATSEVGIGRIEGISLVQGIFGRLLGYGTIVVSGTGTQKAVIRDIENPIKFRQELQSVQTPHEPLQSSKLAR